MENELDKTPVSSRKELKPKNAKPKEAENLKEGEVGNELLSPVPRSNKIDNNNNVLAGHSSLASAKKPDTSKMDLQKPKVRILSVFLICVLAQFKRTN